MNDVLQVVGAVLMLLGSLLSLVAAIGLLRTSGRLGPDGVARAVTGHFTGTVQAREPETGHHGHAVAAFGFVRSRGHPHDVDPPRGELVARRFEHRLIADVHHPRHHADVADGEHGHGSPFRKDAPVAVSRRR